MENKSAFIGALLFIVMVVGANALMYGIVRALIRPTRKGRKDPLQALGEAFRASSKNDDSMEELRRRLEELNGGKKEDRSDSE